MPRWDRPLDHPDSPYRRMLDAEEAPVRGGDGPLQGELGLWLYLGKIGLIILVGGLLLSQAMYGAFALLDLIGG